MEIEDKCSHCGHPLEIYEMGRYNKGLCEACSWEEDSQYPYYDDHQDWSEVLFFWFFIGFILLAIFSLGYMLIFK